MHLLARYCTQNGVFPSDFSLFHLSAREREKRSFVREGGKKRERKKGVRNRVKGGMRGMERGNERREEGRQKEKHKKKERKRQETDR